jgi:hypothetical protein
VYVFGILSIVSVIDDPDYLSKLNTLNFKSLLASCSQLALSFVYILSAILFFPLLWSLNRELAFGGTIFRVLAGLVNLLAITFILSLIVLSREFNSNNAFQSKKEVFSLIGEILKVNRDVFNHVIMIILLNSGGIFFNILFFQSEIIPTWLAIWGIIGCIMAIFASLLFFFNKTTIKSKSYLLLNFPIALQELFFGLWLLFIGLSL